MVEFYLSRAKRCPNSAPARPDFRRKVSFSCIFGDENRAILLYREGEKAGGGSGKGIVAPSVEIVIFSPQKFGIFARFTPPKCLEFGKFSVFCAKLAKPEKTTPLRAKEITLHFYSLHPLYFKLKQFPFFLPIFLQILLTHFNSFYPSISHFLSLLTPFVLLPQIYYFSNETC